MFTKYANSPSLSIIVLIAAINCSSTDTSALIIAADEGHSETVKALLKAGATISARLINNPIIVQAQRKIHNDQVRAKHATTGIQRRLTNEGQDTGFASELAKKIEEYL